MKYLFIGLLLLVGCTPQKATRKPPEVIHQITCPAPYHSGNVDGFYFSEKGFMFWIGEQTHYYPKGILCTAVKIQKD